MRVLVTGGAGFIGGHIVEALVAENHDVVVLDRRPETDSAWEQLPASVDVRRIELTDVAGVASAASDIDAVCHQAAKVGLGVDFDDVVEYVSDNDLGTAVLLQALWRGSFSGRLVVASSMVVYGEGAYRCAVHGSVRPGPRKDSDLAAGQFEPPCPVCGEPLEPSILSEDAPLDPRNVYAATKLHTEHLANQFGREANVPVVSLRYHNVYGPRMPRDTPYAGVASIFRSAVARGEAPQVTEDGGQRRDFVHVADVARANVLALMAGPEVTGPFNIASGEPHTVADLANAVVATNPEIGPPIVNGTWRTGDVRHIVASPARAEAELGFEASISFADGMTAFATDPLADT